MQFRQDHYMADWAPFTQFVNNLTFQQLPGQRFESSTNTHHLLGIITGTLLNHKAMKQPGNLNLTGARSELPSSIPTYFNFNILHIIGMHNHLKVSSLQNYLRKCQDTYF